MRLSRIFTPRVRGVRIVDLCAVVFLIVLVLGVYAFKAGAGREGAQIADVDRQIGEERRQVRALRARLAELERPARLERLSTSYLGLGPAQARREASPEALSELAHPEPTSAPPARSASVGAVNPAGAAAAVR